MKHLFTTVLAVCLSLTAAQAQESATEKAPQEKTMTKEEKQAAREKKEAENNTRTATLPNFHFNKENK